jgi:hypothetical protein
MLGYMSNYTYSVQLVADHHSGKAGFGTKSYHERWGTPTNVTVVHVRYSFLRLNQYDDVPINIPTKLLNIERIL